MASLPAPLVSFFSMFPLISYPAIEPPLKRRVDTATLWIQPPRESGSSFLSADVECLKWQAYLALRGFSELLVRWDISVDGGLGASLPNLHVPADNSPDGELLASHLIPSWADRQLAGDVDLLEGYKNQACLDESHAWVSLLEGKVHAALILHQKPEPLLSFLTPSRPKTIAINTMISPPPPSLISIGSILPASLLPFALPGSSGSAIPRISPKEIDAEYSGAISALSQCLGTDKWFLGSANPTPLDALAFAYLHTILHSDQTIRIEVTRRVNLVAWESRVRVMVAKVFVQRR